MTKCASPKAWPQWYFVAKASLRIKPPANTKVSIWFYACHCYRGLKTMLPISVAFSAMTFWQGFCCKVNAESTTDCRKGYEKGRPLTVSLCSNFSSEDIRLFWKVERELLGLPCFFCTSYAIYFNVPTQGVFLLSLHRLRATSLLAGCKFPYIFFVHISSKLFSTKSFHIVLCMRHFLHD